jgi:hypothetical protein
MDGHEMWCKAASCYAGCPLANEHDAHGRLGRGCRRLRRRSRAKTTETEDRGTRERKDKVRVMSSFYGVLKRKRREKTEEFRKMDENP